MLLPREKNIVELLFKNKEKKMTTSTMAAELHVSQRTIKADVKKINELLENNGCTLKTKAGVGMWLEYTETGEKFLKTLLYNEKKASALLPDSRKYYIAWKILEQAEYISMEAVSHELFISKGTVTNDLNELERFWSKYDLQLIKKVKYGIKVAGEEKQIRTAQVEVVRKIIGSQGKGLVERAKPFFEDVDLLALKGALIEAETKFDFILADISYFEFFVQMAIIVSRNKRGLFYESDSQKIQYLRQEREWKTSEFLKVRMETSENINLHESETAYMTILLRGAKLQKIYPENKDEWMTRRASSPEMFDNMMAVLKRADEIYQLELSFDNTLVCALFDHLKSMIKRVKDKILLENPILETIKSQLIYEYEIATYVTDRFSWQYGMNASEDEIGYVAFHIGASIERTMAKKVNIQPSVTLICATGVGTSQFLEAKLTRLFPNLKVGHVLPINKVDMLTPDMQDFIISTVPLYIEGLDIICISPVLKEEDMKHIRERIRIIVSKESLDNASYQQLSQMLHPEIAILNCDCKSKEEVIQLMGTRLMREGYVDEGYIDSVFEREALAPAAIGNLFAIPHAFEGHILKQGIGIITLKNPIIWGEEKVQIVFMLAVDSRSKEKFQGVFGEIVDLTKDAHAMEQLLKAVRFDEFDIF